MYTTSDLGIDGANSTDDSPHDDGVISVGLLVPGLAIVLMNCIILFSRLTNRRHEPEEWFRLLGLSSCDLLCGVVVIVISALAFHPLSELACKMVHILMPTLSCAQLYYMLAVLLYEDLVLRDTVRNARHNNGGFLIVFVFVSWFMSLVICSLPIVADTSAVEYNGNCSPEAIFQQTWRQAMLFYCTIFFLPLLTTNMLYVKHLIVLRKLQAKVILLMYKI